MKKTLKMAAMMLAATAFMPVLTSCDEDLVNMDELINTDNFRIRANSDGTITFVGDVSSNAKIKEFKILYGPDYDLKKNIAYDFVEENDVVKERLKLIEDDGTVSKEKVFSVKDIESAPLDVDFYMIYLETRRQKAETYLGEDIEFTIGAKNSQTGSYLSIVKNSHYSMEEAKTTSVEVIAESSSDGNDVVGLKAATKAASEDVKKNAGHVALFHNGEPTEVATEGDVIITESGCICKITSITNTTNDKGKRDATIKGIIIRDTDNFMVDVDGYAFE